MSGRWAIEDKLALCLAIIMQKKVKPDWPTLPIPGNRSFNGASQLLSAMIREEKKKFVTIDGNGDGEDDNEDETLATPKRKLVSKPRTKKSDKNPGADAEQETEDPEKDGDVEVTPATSAKKKTPRKPRARKGEAKSQKSDNASIATTVIKTTEGGDGPKWVEEKLEVDRADDLEEGEILDVHKRKASTFENAEQELIASSKKLKGDCEGVNE